MVSELSTPGWLTIYQYQANGAFVALQLIEGQRGCLPPKLTEVFGIEKLYRAPGDGGS